MTRYLPSCRPPKLYLPVASFFFNDTATTEIYSLSLHDALPILDTVQPTSGVPSARLPSPLTSSRTWPALVPSLKLPKSVVVSFQLQPTLKAESRLPHVATALAVEGDA